MDDCRREHCGGLHECSGRCERVGEFAWAFWEHQMHTVHPYGHCKSERAGVHVANVLRAGVCEWGCGPE